MQYALKLEKIGWYMRIIFNIFNAVIILLALNLATTAQAAPPQTRISAGGLKYMTGGIGNDEVEEHTLINELEN